MKTTKTTMVRELRAVYSDRKGKLPDQVMDAESLSVFVRSVLPDDTQEHFVVMALDIQHRPIAWSIATSGLASSTQIHPREIFKIAILANASKIAVAHNHPSGSLTPSKEDQDVTRQIKECGDLLKIPLLDSVIVTESKHLSLLHTD